MFLQVGLREEDRDVCRLLWRKDKLRNPLTTYRLTRVCFRLACSPYLDMQVANHHLSANHDRFGAIADDIKASMYVEDLVVSCDTVAEAKNFVCRSSELLASGRFHLAKWASNVPQVLVDRPTEETHENKPSRLCKTLGVSWNPQEEELTFRPSELVDDDLPVDVECQWRIWKSELDDLPSIALPRAYFPSSPVETSRLGLHGFGDASKAAYSAVVYLKAVKSPENVSVSFVTAKSKVAPLKKLSIPRLELMAALLCARLVCYVRKELPLNVEACHCWSDSLVALGCIRGEACRWKPFMANRVRKIQPGELRMQHHHPCSLCNQVAWTVLVTGSPIGLVDARRPKHPRRRGGSRARMTFYGCRYDDHSSPGRNIHLRSRKEISPFLDEFGILRVGGLPGRANLDGRTKHLILLPHRDWLIELLIRREHLRGCTICRRVTAPPFQQRMSELPEMRVEPVGLFVNVGVDFAGPLLIRSDGPNRLTQKATFIARHGRPVIMQSDNFQTSRKAGRFLQSVFDALNWEAVQRHLDTERARWQFITERAFWCGGYWERMVRSVKAALRKAVGRRMLNFDELRTVLCEVEARINDRPPTLVFDEPQE
ncbi:hypothetical protein T4B_2422 [Trichinella pseudospiralis]|uniref:Integrase catalytic domain-containing protein n=1 Tax=Trichinella pseudospiralis TaxID=6337 RepID=A0A0V1H1B3_TRIPS|nr:hypothetical protein T4B_2422 [Trichinella pseudospiralis]